MVSTLEGGDMIENIITLAIVVGVVAIFALLRAAKGEPNKPPQKDSEQKP